jgi:thymidylate kinase
MSGVERGEAVALRAAAALALGQAGAEARAGAPEIDPGLVAGILRRNKVPLCHLTPGVVPVSWSASEPWRDAAAMEAAEQEALRRELAPVCAGLRAEGIEPILFKTPGGIPYRSSNVDLLVRPGQFARAAAALERAGHIRLPHYREDHKLLFHRFRSGRSTVSVHLHEAVSWGRVMVLPGDGVAAAARPSPEGFFHVASAVDLAMATLAHSLYETDQVRLNDLRLLRLCAAEAGFSWDEVEGRAGAAGWRAGLHAIVLLAAFLEESLAGTSCVPAPLVARARETVSRSGWMGSAQAAARRAAREGTPPMPWRFSRAWSKAHYVARLLTQPARAPEERLQDLAATAWNLAANRWGLRCRPASLIAVSGLDGAGKSTVVGDLEAALRLCEVPARVVWSRGGFSRGAGWLKRSARRAMPGRVPGPAETHAKQAWLARPLPAALYAAFVSTEQALRFTFSVRLPGRLGWTLVCDRYATDAAAEMSSRLGESRLASRAAVRLLTGLAPRPHLAILLRLSAAEAARRKPEDADPDELARRADALDRLASRQGLLVVDASAPLEAVRGEVVERVLRAVFARFEGRAA